MQKAVGVVATAATAIIPIVAPLIKGGLQAQLLRKFFLFVSCFYVFFFNIYYKIENEEGKTVNTLSDAASNTTAVTALTSSYANVSRGVGLRGTQVN